MSTSAKEMEMKKLIAAVVIATSAFGAQQVSAMGMKETICHNQTEYATEFYQKGYDGESIGGYEKAVRKSYGDGDNEVMRNMIRGIDYNLFAYQAGQNHENYFLIKEQIFDVCMMNVEEPQL